MRRTLTAISLVVLLLPALRNWRLEGSASPESARAGASERVEGKEEKAIGDQIDPAPGARDTLEPGARKAKNRRYNTGGGALDRALPLGQEIDVFVPHTWYQNWQLFPTAKSEVVVLGKLLSFRGVPRDLTKAENFLSSLRAAVAKTR